MDVLERRDRLPDHVGRAQREHADGLAVWAPQVRVPTNIVSSICDDRGEEPTYNGVDMSTLIEGEWRLPTLGCSPCSDFPSFLSSAHHCVPQSQSKQCLRLG